MEEAISKVKSDLGPEAIILHTRKLQRSWPMSLLRNSTVEITAALDVNLMDNDDAGNNKNASPKEALSNVLEERLDVMHSEMEEIKTLIKTIADQLTDPLFQEVPACFLDIYESLLSNKVDDDIAKKLMKSVQEQLTTAELANPDILRDRTMAEIAKSLPIASPIHVDSDKQKVIALIGPTGAGKTTTIAKLAARHCLYEGKRAVLISADTYRIAAVEQLKTYAEIIGAPIEIIFNNQDAREAIEAHSDKDIVFIDTAGRSPLNENQMSELAGLINVCNPDEVHLVLSVTTKLSDQMSAVNRFSVVPLNRIIFTKLDESKTLGTMLNIANRVKVPISYITVGQNVPEDIKIAEPQKLANLILGVPLDE
jgi:flagellar biosynthesis protein FlhF